MKQFRAVSSETENRIIISLKGELDASGSLEADVVLEESILSGVKAILIDCRELNYISSAGLGVLLAAYSECNTKGVNLVFFGLQTKIRNVFDILGLQNIFSIVATYEDAILTSV